MRFDPHTKADGDCASCHTSKEVEIEVLRKALAVKDYYRILSDTDPLVHKKVDGADLMRNLHGPGKVMPPFKK